MHRVTAGTTVAPARLKRENPDSIESRTRPFRHRDTSPRATPGRHMIYVVEFPHHGRPTAWFAFDREDFARKVHARRTGKHTLSSAASARQRLDAAGLAPDSADARQSEPEVFRLADTHGWDTPLYRADDLPGEGVNRTETVSEFDACVAAIAAGLKACRVYLSDQAATAALYQDPLYDGLEGFHAHMALREQLIALEVIADDL